MSSQIKTIPEAHIHQGLPSLQTSGHKKVTSLFEFWPTWLIYIPVVIQWLILAARYKSLSLPLIANPSIELSGMVGESKSAILNLLQAPARPWVAPFSVLENKADMDISQRLHMARQAMQQNQLGFPLIAKPDMGCRGAGVKIIQHENDLQDYLSAFPTRAQLILQQKIEYEAEAGIFYIRRPGSQHGEIFSITLKYAPYVIGDGCKTLRQLIYDDPRASKIAPLYLRRHGELLDNIIPQQQAFRLSFAGSHCRGSIFRNGNAYITDKLRETFDQLTASIPEYYYGRFDVRFSSIKELMAGENFTILEINGASSEATHIWDRNTRLREVYRSLFYQYKTLFQIGHQNRLRGIKTPGVMALLKAWRKEAQLVNQYPETD